MVGSECEAVLFVDLSDSGAIVLFHNNVEDDEETAKELSL
jgi:hypothetical protein